MSDVKCFLIEPTGKVSVGLRRFVFQDKERPETSCPGYGYHNARAKIGLVDKDTVTTPEGYLAGHYILYDRNDPRSPTKCEHCDYVFKDSDEWQIWLEEEMRRTDTGEIFLHEDAPPGAVEKMGSWVEQFHSPQHERRGGGPHYQVMLPNKVWWDIDGPSNNGNGWERTGEPPNFSVTPSILAGSYHGFLTNGVLRSV